MMNKFKLLLVLFAVFFSTNLQAHSISHQTLVTVHGFLGSTWNMYYMVKGYSKKKVKIHHYGYNSRHKLIQEHGADLAHYLKKLAEKSPGVPINFITHSMGGLVLRSAMNHTDCPPEAKIGRAALLAPPNQGDSWARTLEQFSLVNVVVKSRSGKQLMTQNDFEFLGQFPDTVEVLVIAGKGGINPFIKEKNDGTVAIEETYLTTPHHHKIIKAEHSLILINSEANNLIKKFFREDF